LCISLTIMFRWPGPRTNSWWPLHNWQRNMELPTQLQCARLNTTLRHRLTSQRTLFTSDKRQRRRRWPSTRTCPSSRLTLSSDPSQGISTSTWPRQPIAGASCPISSTQMQSSGQSTRMMSLRQSHTSSPARTQDISVFTGLKNTPL